MSGGITGLTLFLGEINTITWPSRLVESQISDSQTWPRVPRNSDQRKAALMSPAHPTSHQRGRPTLTDTQMCKDDLKRIRKIVRIQMCACHRDRLTGRLTVNYNITSTLTGVTLCEGWSSTSTVVAAGSKKKQKGNPVPRGITGPPCSWGI
jgi:hypothetical protein